MMNRTTRLAIDFARNSAQNVTTFALLTLALGETFTMHETVRANLASLGVTDQASALAWWHAR